MDNISDKESIFVLQCLDTNCNDCIHMNRDLDKLRSFDDHYKGQEKASWRIRYGDCQKLNKEVSFIPNHAMPKNRDCFEHRRKEKLKDVYDEYVADIV